MAVIHHFPKRHLLPILVLALCAPTLAETVQSPTCAIQGDPDIYGIGIRCSFYLQWASLIVVLVFCPREGGALRTASTITTLAVYINTFHSMRQGSLVAVDYPLLWYLTSALTFFNWPVTKVGYKRDGGSQAMVLVVWAMYYIAGPWVFFKGLQAGRKPGCDVKYVIFVPVSIYNKALLTFMKVASVISVITAVILLSMALTLVRVWFESWRDTVDLVDDEDEEDESLIMSRILAFMQAIVGALSISFAERVLRANRVTFPGSSIANSGQLIPLLIGIFTFAASIISAMRATTRRSRVSSRAASRFATNSSDVDLEPVTELFR